MIIIHLQNFHYSLAEARAARGDESVTIATEMQKFLPLIRFSTMTPNEFRIIVDSSALLETETVLNLHRYFIATDPIEKCVQLILELILVPLACVFKFFQASNSFRVYV